MNPNVTKGAVVVLVVTLVFYWLALGPAYAKLNKRAREIRALETERDKLKRNLRSLPPVPAEERKLWRRVESWVDRKLLRPQNVLAVLVGLSTMVKDSGARLLAGAIEDPPKRPPPRSGEGRAPAVRAGREPPGRDLEESARARGDTSGTDSARGRARRPKLRPSTAIRSPAAPRTGRAARKGSVARNALHSVGGREITHYPVEMEVSGPYAAWPDLLNELSRREAPVLLERIEGRRGDGSGLLEVKLAAPALAAPRTGGPAPSAALGPAPFYVPGDTAALYGLPAWQAKLRAPWPATRGNPFSEGDLVGEEGSGLPRPTSILRRNGRFVAVIGGVQRLVGDLVAGYRIIKITQHTIFYGL